MKIFEKFMKIKDFWKFAKNWRFLKILFKIEDFSTLIKDFLKFAKSSIFTKIWKIFNLGQIFKNLHFQFRPNFQISWILTKIWIIFRFDQNLKNLQFIPNFQKFSQILVKVEDFSIFKKSSIKVEKSSTLNKFSKIFIFN